MRSKVMVALAAAALVVVPAVAGAQGVQAEGWEHRLDFGGEVNDVLSFDTMGTGVHVTTQGTGFATFWQPNSMAKGDFTISATFTQVERSGHANAYGLFLGGSDLAGDGQQYTYFMLRQGGEFLIKRRMGEDPADPGRLDYPRRRQRSQRPGLVDQHALGGSCRGHGALSGERHRGVDAAALGRRR